MKIKHMIYISTRENTLDTFSDVDLDHVKEYSDSATFKSHFTVLFF